MPEGKTRIPPVDVETLPDDLRETLEEQEKLRGAPLYPYLFYARNPAYFRAAKAMWAALQQETKRVLARLTSAPEFRRRFDGLSEEAKLRRVPREFPRDHPAAEWLKLQSFTARASIEPSVVTSPRLVDRLCRDFTLLVPLVRWLNRALGYQPAKARTGDTP